MMTKEQFIDALDTCDDPEEGWRLLVEFVADWVEHLTDETIDGYSAQAVVDQWREEMA